MFLVCKMLLNPCPNCSAIYLSMCTLETHTSMSKGSVIKEHNTMADKNIHRKAVGNNTGRPNVRDTY